MNRLMPWIFVSLFVGAAPAAAVPSIADALQPHTALYQLELAPGDRASGIADATGLIGFEWRASCERYTTSQRFFTQFVTTEGVSSSSDIVLRAEEAVDGSTFDFDVADSVNGRVADHVVGRAEAGTLHYIMPGGRHDLPAGTIFPTQHSAQLIESALSGQPYLEARVFDGGAEDEIYDTVARIDVARGGFAPAPDSVGVARLGALPSWIISMSYYDIDDPFGQPNYEITYRLFANGIVDELFMDYGDYAFRARLVQLDYLDYPSC